MRRSLMVLLVAASVLTMSSFTDISLFNKSDEAGENYTLKFNPPTGTTGTMIMDYTMKISMEVMGQAMDMDQTMEMGAKMEVTDNTSKEVMTNMIYDFFAMSMTNPMMGEMAYDSRKTDNEGMLAEQLEGAFKEIIGKEIQLVQDKTGKTIKTEGMDEVLGMNRSQGSLDFSSVLGMSRFPEKPISIGDSWEVVMDDESSPMRIDTKMTLANVKDGKVYISFDSKVSGNENFDMGKALEDAEAEVEEEPELDISGTQSGSFVYDKATMWMIEGMITQNLNMNVEQMGMEIPMTVKGDMILTMD